MPTFAGTRSSTLRPWVLSLSLTCLATLAQASASFSKGRLCWVWRSFPGSEFFLLARLLFVHYAPVSEEAKACKKAKGTRNKPKPKAKPNQTTTKTTKPTHKPNTTKRQIPLQQVKPVRRVRRSPHRTGETEGRLGPKRGKLNYSRTWCQGNYGFENYID